MNDKKFSQLILVTIIGFMLFNLYFWGTYFIQPIPYHIGTEANQQSGQAYVDPDRVYYLKGEMECYPLASLSSPSTLDSVEALSISNLGGAKNAACIKGDNYVAAIRYYINAPLGMEYSLLIPGEFCEYTFFVNGLQVAQTKTFNSATPSFPSPVVVELPGSETGSYEILGYIITPVNATLASKASTLFGSREALHSLQVRRSALTAGFCGSIIAMLIFCSIQCLALRREKTLPTYIILGLAIIFRTLITGETLIIHLFPNMDYRVGLFLRCITMPWVLITIVYHTKAMFPSLMPKRLPLIVSSFQLLNFINGLTLRKFVVLESLTYISYTLCYGLVLYVSVRALLRKYPYSFLFGIGTMQLIVSGLMEAATQNFVEPMRHSQLYPLAIFTIIELYIFAKQYAAQSYSELYYQEELSRALEARRASENAFLNAQMKPHFLYNTLNTIADLCVTDSDKAISLIKSLEEYCHLIIGIDNMEKTVPLAQEMQLVSAYTRIEKERFPSINFYTDLPIRMPLITVPPLTLQPLIENAIKHGVRKSDKPGAVTLRIRDEYDCVRFYVSDNGVGMDEETAAKLLTEVPKENKSVGIYNINKRLGNLYNTKLEVDSSVGLGTCISFSIPK